MNTNHCSTKSQGKTTAHDVVKAKAGVPVQALVEQLRTAEKALRKAMPIEAREPIPEGTLVRDFVAGELEVKQAILDAIDLKPVKFTHTDLNGVEVPYDTATPRALIAVYQRLAALRGGTGVVEEARARLATRVRLSLSGAYAMVREVARRDSDVEEALRPALRYHDKVADSRRRTLNAEKQVVQSAAAVEATTLKSAKGP